MDVPDKAERAIYGIVLAISLAFNAYGLGVARRAASEADHRVRAGLCQSVRANNEHETQLRGTR